MTVNLSLKNVPKSVHRQLQNQAERHGRSMNAEILQILTAATRRNAALNGLMDDLDAFNQRLATRDMEPVDLREAKESGRT